MTRASSRASRCWRVGLAGALSFSAVVSAGPPIFVQHDVPTVLQQPSALQANDLDGDGDMDVAVALAECCWSGAIAWYETDLPAGSSEPTFEEHVIRTFGSNGASAVTTADLDGDGLVDIVGSAPPSAMWFKNDGGSPPSFVQQPFPSGSSANFFSSDDLDGDGDVDIVGAYFSGDSVFWLENLLVPLGVPIFVKHDVGSIPGAVSARAADLDDDGDMDIAASGTEIGPGLPQIVWFESNGSTPPTFTKHVIEDPGRNTSGVFPADLNGDGHVDILEAGGPGSSQGIGSVVLFVNDRAVDPTFSKQVVRSDGIRNRNSFSGVFAADMNDDGYLDALSTTSDLREVDWYENDGAVTPSFTRRNISSSLTAAGKPMAVDLEGDGDVDVVAASSNGQKIVWFRSLLADPPVAYAGGPYVAECGVGSTAIALDGRGSSHPNNELLDYSWTTKCTAASFDLDSSSTPVLTLEDGPTSCSVRLVVEDPRGNVSSDSTSVTVEDTTAPALTAPADVVAECSSAGPQAVDIGQATVTDCDPDPALSNDAPTTFSLGTTTVTWTALDLSGNSAESAQAVMVVDTTAPVATCPADLVLEPTAPEGNVVEFVASAADVCDPSPSQVCTPVSGSLFAVGTANEVVCPATDATGNSSSCSFVVTILSATDVVDSIAEQIEALSEADRLNGPGGNGLLNNLRTISRSIESGRVGPACDKLADFIAKIDEFVAEGLLTPEEAAPILASSANLQATLGC